MSCIVKSYDKKTGITYLYSSESRWDPVRKRPSPVRKCIGKLDPITGKPVPTGKRGRPRKTTPVSIFPESSTLSADTVTLQKQLSEALERIQKDEALYRDMEARLKGLEAENRQLKLKLNCYLSSLGSLKKAFSSHCAVAEEL